MAMNIGEITGIKVIDASDEFTKQGFKKVLEITGDFVWTKDETEKETKIKELIKFGEIEGAVAKIFWDNVPNEAILICFTGLYFPQVVLIKNFLRKMDDYFKYLKK